MGVDTYTKVNYEQLENLLNSFENCENKCTLCLENFISSMSRVSNCNYMEGVTIEGISQSINKAQEVLENFKRISSPLKAQLRLVSTATDEIERKYDMIYSELLGQDPTKFNALNMSVSELTGLHVNNELKTLYGPLAAHLEQTVNLEKLGYSSGQEYIEDVIDKAVKSADTNREKSVNAVRALTSLAAENGVKLNYDYGGGHGSPIVTDKNVSSSTDCSGFVSWAVQKGAVNPNDFTTGSTYTLIQRGQNITNVASQPGDFVVNYQHTGFILSNDAKNQEIVLAEALNNSEGVTVRTYTYDDLARLGYTFKDMSEYYGDVNSQKDFSF